MDDFRVGRRWRQKSRRKDEESVTNFFAQSSPNLRFIFGRALQTRIEGTFRQEQSVQILFSKGIKFFSKSIQKVSNFFSQNEMVSNLVSNIIFYYYLINLVNKSVFRPRESIFLAHLEYVLNILTTFPRLGKN